ncbi:hypothetical protein C0989_008178 [Termitomyces sp. Mn162]|nr:hypothetical protein C0989_008178 [Termitomyces sp. Mn162]
MRESFSDVQRYEFLFHTESAGSDLEWDYVLTAQKKKKTESRTNVSGRRSQPSPRRMARKMMSTGSVTSASVIITSRVLGSEKKKTKPRTAYNNRKQHESLIPARERIEHDPCAAAQDHGAEKRRPALVKEGADVGVAHCDDKAEEGEADDEDAKDEGNGGVDDADEGGGDGAHPEEGDEIAEARGDGGRNVVWCEWADVRQRRGWGGRTYRDHGHTIYI